MNELRIFDSIFHQNKNYPLEKSITQITSGQLKSYSTKEVVNTINSMSTGLLNAGYLSGDKFSIAAFNSYQWAIVDIAASQIGMIHVPLYPNASEEDYKFILDQADVKVTFAGNAEIAEKLKKASAGAKRDSYTFFQDNQSNGWEQLIKEPSKDDLEKIDSIRNKIKAEELATIIYTSGTTGEPKGVMLSHKNIMSNAQDVGDAIQIKGKKYHVLSFLPLCHIFERTALYTYLYMGMSIYYPENLDNLGDDLRLVKPHFFTTVPRVLEKIYEKIEAKASTLSATKQIIFNWSLKQAKAFEPGKKLSLLAKLKLNIADKLVFSKWRDAVGNNIRFIVSGAAALHPDLVRVFTAAGIPILEAYGLTEASPGITMTRNNPEEIRAGSVGKALESVQVKINDDGEVLAKGPNIMMGYYLRPESTAEVLRAGWLHTGDLGTIDQEGDLYITGRKKELFKTSGGKYIAPQKIENLLKSSSYIDQVIVVGEDEKYPAALIVPSFEKLRQEFPGASGETTDYNNIAEIRAHYSRIIEEHNSVLGRYEQVKAFHLLSNAWTIESGELTPTMKVKRKIIQQRYIREIKNLF